MAVLCQVDVAVIILGANNTFYEFSSVDADDLISHYQNDDLPHDAKDPSDYGDYQKKDKVIIQDRKKRKALSIGITRPRPQQAQEITKRKDSTNEDVEGDDEDDTDDEETVPFSANKKIKRETSAKFNSLQEQVQRQFHNLYNASTADRNPLRVFNPSQPPASFNRGSYSNVFVNNDSAASLSSTSNPVSVSLPARGGSSADDSLAIERSNTNMPTTPSALNRSGTVTRPVLRVQIPKNSGVTVSPIKSESTSASSPAHSGSGSQFQKNKGYIELPRPKGSNNNTPSSATAPGLPASPLMMDQHNKNSLTNKTVRRNSSGNVNGNNGFMYGGLPSAITASPSIQQYFATPLQPTANGVTALGSMPSSNPHNYLMHKQVQQAQQAQQQQQQRQHQQHQQHQQAQQHMLQSGSANSTGDNAGGLAGSLPSKFVHDLMVPSPSTSMNMFHDWGFASNSAVPNTSIASKQHSRGNDSATNTNPGSSTIIGNNGSTGLTPFITVNQTPLGNRFFNFNEINDDKDSDKS